MPARPPAQHAAVHELDERVHDALRDAPRRRCASYGTPNRKCASITSSALFASVALSTVILRPICHVGWRSASSSVALLELLAAPVAERPARRREDQAAHLRPRPAREALQDGAVLAVDRHDLAAAARAASPTSAPAITSVSLFASATRFPARERGERGVEPRRADDRVEDDVRVGSASRPRRGTQARGARSPDASCRSPDEPTKAARVALDLLREQRRVRCAVSAAT